MTNAQHIALRRERLLRRNKLVRAKRLRDYFATGGVAAELAAWEAEQRQQTRKH